MVQACLYLLAGVYALQLSSFATGSDLFAVAFVAFFVAWFLDAWRGVSWLFAGLALFALSAGSINAQRLSPGYAGDSIVSRVRVADFPEQRDTSVSFLASPLDDDRLPPRVRLSWFEPEEAPAFGDIWQLELRLRRPRGNRNPGNFDYEAWLFREAIGATGYVVAGRRNLRLREGDLGPIDSARQRVVDRLQRLPLDADNAAVLAAISVGARHLLSRSQWDRYARTGTSHLMAISGLHIGLAAGGGYLLASIGSGLLLRRCNYHTIATIAAAGVAVMYGLASGLALPSQRAALMICLLACAVVRRRLSRPARILASACIVLAALAPISTMAPGFKLSFAAVLILIWLARRVDLRLQRVGSRRWLGAVRQLGTAQLVLLLGLLPLTVGIFGRVSLVAPIVNMVAVPVFSFLTVPLALGGILLDGPLALVGDRVLQAAAWSIGVVESVTGIAARVPGAAASVADLKGLAGAYLLVPLLWVVLPPAWPGRWFAWLGLVAVVLHEPARPEKDCVELDVLDVGQGLAIVIRTTEHVLLYDTGPAFRSGQSMAETVVLPYLAAMGIDRIDTLIVSHADLDHAGGVERLLQGVGAKRVLAGEVLPGISRPYQACGAGSEWRAGIVGFRILHPETGSSFAGNDRSCVMEVQVGDHRMLVSGDIERAAEQSLLQNDALAPVTIAIVPHHGSRTSSSEAFVAALRPELAIVSAGYGNRWGFPKADVVGRWRSAGARVLNTAESGAVRTRVCAATGLEALEQYRPDHRRIWHE